VLKGDNIAVKIEGNKGIDISADATIKGILDANASIDRKANNSVTLNYKTENDQPMIFAFKAQQIIYEKKSFWRSEPAHFRIKEQKGVVLMTPEEIPTIPLQTGGELINL
jgi:hypothetical protein